MSKMVDQFRMILNPCDLAMLRGATTRINIKLHHFFADLHMMMYKDWLLSQKQQMSDRMEHLSWP